MVITENDLYICYAVIDLTHKFSNLYFFGKNNMSKNKDNFNEIKGTILLISNRVYKMGYEN